MKATRDLVAGDMVDLQDDEFADPECNVGDWENCKHPEFHFQYEVVESTELETPNCICVYFESGFTCGFPPEHKVYTSEDAR